MDKQLEKEIGLFIARELAKGTSLSDIQTMVNENFDQHMTYMDIRILASSLDVDWKALDPHAAKPKTDDAAENAPADETEAVDGADEAEQPGEAPAAGSTAVELNPIARPGMMFSGSVRFASGSTAEWYLDNMGRIGLENLVGDKPSPQDVEQFQIELDKVLRKAMGR